MGFARRPAASPVLAGLAAAGMLHPADRILDVGCGDGTDLLDLARWGFRHLVGVERDRRELGVARRRATRMGLSPPVKLLEGDARRLAELFPSARFDAVIDTLLLNNIEANPDDAQAYARSVAHVLRPDGLFLCQPRIAKRSLREGPGLLPPEFDRYFTFAAPPIPTLLPEYPPEDRYPPVARVSVHIGRRNHRNPPRPGGRQGPKRRSV